ncbi:MAG: hypothetical protein LW832_08075 [Parachlamydia sp.]|nr:hypothetical protein [Parachlamydia sp.]
MNNVTSNKRGRDYPVTNQPAAKRPKKNSDSFSREKFLIKWNELIPPEKEFSVGTVETLSQKFYKLKRSIPWRQLLKKDRTLGTIHFLLKVIHPCPMKEKARDYELKIFEKINQLIEEKFFKKPEAQRLLQHILVDCQPSFVYDYACLKNQQAELEIKKIEAVLTQSDLDFSQVQSNFESIFTILNDEIKRFRDVLGIYSQLSMSDPLNIAHLMLGKCHKAFADQCILAGKHHDREGFKIKALFHFSKAMPHFDFCEGYFKKYTTLGTKDQRDELEQLFLECKEANASLLKNMEIQDDEGIVDAEIVDAEIVDAEIVEQNREIIFNQDVQVLEDPTFDLTIEKTPTLQEIFLVCNQLRATMQKREKKPLLEEHEIVIISDSEEEEMEVAPLSKKSSEDFKELFSK